MNPITFFIFLVSILSPGCLVFLINRFSTPEKIIFIPIISVVSNGLIYAVMRDLEILSLSSLLIYYCAVSFILFFVFVRRRKKFSVTQGIKSILNSINKNKIISVILLFFALLSFYYSMFFPPVSFDTRHYHLIVPQSVEKGTYFKYLTQGGSLEGAFKGISTAYEMFYYPFFSLNSTIYHILPTIFGILLLLEIFLLMRYLDIQNPLLSLGIWIAALSPNIMFHSSVHLTTIPLATAFLGATLLFLKYLNTQETFYLYFGAFLLGIGALIKPSLLYLSPFTFALIFIFLFSRRGKILTDKLKELSLTFLIFLTTSSYLIYRKIALPFAESWPGFSGHPQSITTLLKFLLKTFVKFPLPTINFGISLAVILLAPYSLYRLFIGLRDQDCSNLNFLKIISFGWLVLMTLGTVFYYRIPGVINSLPRYFFPGFVILIISEMKDLDALFGKISISKKNILIFAVAASVLIAPLIQQFVSCQKINYITKRYGNVTYCPFCPKREKLTMMANQYTEGGEAIKEEYLAWEYINSHEKNPEATVLTDFHAPYYLDYFIYVPSSVNIRMKPSKFRDWLSQNNVNWIVKCEEDSKLDSYLELGDDYTKLVHSPVTKVPDCFRGKTPDCKVYKVS